jgi:hypothetical protein
MAHSLNELPDYAEEAMETIPNWLEELEHSEGAGRYRAAVDAFEPYETYSTWMARRILQFVQEEGVSEEQRTDWIEYVRGHQRENGMFHDERLERRMLIDYEDDDHLEWMDEHGHDNSHIYYMQGRSIYWIDWTTTAMGILDALGGEPKYPVPEELPEQARVEDDHDPWEAPPEKFLYDDGEEMRAYLEGLDWTDPWGASQWTGRVISRHRLAESFYDRDVDAVIDAAVDWLTEKQDPETGAWFDGDPPLHARINGIYKIWKGLLGSTDLPVQYPDSVVDLCIEALETDPRLTGIPDSLCIWDAGLVSNVALEVTDHRRDELTELAAEAMPKLEAMYRPDGAFSYTPYGSTGIFGPFKLSPAKNQSDIGGTGIVLSATAELATLCGLREEWGRHVPSESLRSDL